MSNDLIEAAKAGDLAAVQASIAAGADVNAADERGWGIAARVSF